MVRKKVVIAMSDSGEGFLKVQDTGIPPLFLLVDGVRLRGFAGDRNTYISIEEVISWYKNEIEATGDRDLSYSKKLNDNLEVMLKRRDELVEARMRRG
jgi:hypothetical protein